MSLAAVLLVVGARQDAAAQEGPSGQLAGVELGAQLYAVHCASCHAADGGGGTVPRFGGEAPSMRPEDNPNMEAAYLDLVMTTGRMPPAGSPYDNRTRAVVFDADQRAALIAYMAEQFGVDGPELRVAEGDAAAGREVWAQNCTHCHGPAGAGGVAGAGAWTPSVSDKSAEQIAQAIRVGPFQMPAFRQLSAADVDDVAAFMAEVNQEPSTPLFGLVELNPVYASGFAALMVAAVLVAMVVIAGRPTAFADADAQAEAEAASGTRRAVRAQRRPKGVRWLVSGPGPSQDGDDADQADGPEDADADPDPQETR